MVSGFFRAWGILAWIRQDIRGPSQRADLDFGDLIRMQVILFHQVEKGGDRRMSERFGGKELHAALRDPPALSEAVGEDVQLPFRTIAMDQAFLAVNNMLGAGVALLC